MLRRIPSIRRLNSDINVTPMADVMLVLLIIFMITTPILQKNIPINPPIAQDPVKTEIAKPLTLSPARDGRIYLGKTNVTEKKMIQALSKHFAGEEDKSIFLRADQALAYGKVVHIVDECRKPGVQRVGLIAEKENN
jgi:biopolymer transport protein TolR